VASRREKSRALADTPRLLKGPKLVSHDFFVTPSSRNGLSKPTADGDSFCTDLVLEYARCCRVMDCNKGVVSRHLRSDLYLGHIFLLDIPAVSFAIHRNLRRSKVVENIAMVDYAPISATRTTPYHSKIRWVMLSPDGEESYKAPGREGWMQDYEFSLFKPSDVDTEFHAHYLEF
jgi:hypothetical protein